MEQAVRYTSLLNFTHEEFIVAANIGRAYFGIYGYHFDPAQVTEFIGLEPTATNDSGTRGSLDKPALSSWEFSTKSINSDEQVVDMFKLIDDDLLKKIEPSKEKIIEICKNLNLSPRVGVVLTLSVDKDENVPEVGFGSRIVKFCSEIGAFINVEYELSERI